jgi:hypothetical protein
MKVTEIIVESKPGIGDSFSIELGDLLIETGIIGLLRDGVLVETDTKTLAILKMSGVTFESTKFQLAEGRMSDVNIIFQEIVSGNEDISRIMNNPTTSEEKYAGEQLQELYSSTAEDYELDPEQHEEAIFALMKEIIARDYLSDVPEQTLHEAEYQGRKVSLGKPMAGDVKKSKVYVKGPKGNVVKVNFGDKKMKIKKSNPKRRKSFRARHNCDNPGPRWRARYWSCRAW